MTDCGPTQYLKRDLYANPPTSSCVDCYSLTQQDIDENNLQPKLLDPNAEENLVEFFRRMSNDTDPVIADQFGDLLINYGQCDNYEIFTGRTVKLAKESANEGLIIVDNGDWEFLKMYNEGDNIQNICNNSNTADSDINKRKNVRMCEIMTYYINSEGYLSSVELEREIRRQFGTANQVSTSGSIDYILPGLPQEYGPLAGNDSVEAYKEAIHLKRGKNIKRFMFEYIQSQRMLRSLRDGVVPLLSVMPSKDNIISEEIYDFWIELNRRDTTKSSDIGGINLQDLFSGQPSSTEFEICMNGLFDRRLHSNREYDSDIQETISNRKAIVELTHTEINYIEDKLKVIATMEPDDAMECMNILNLGEMICDKGVSDRMLKMAYLVFHIIGLDKMDLDTIERGSKDYYHLTKILDRLTPYIRRAVRKILEISKHYELKTCGYESTTTHVLETIYMDVFEKTKEVDVHIDSLDFIPTYLIKDTNMMEFTRTIILLIVTIAGVYVLLMVLNRPVIK
jgi:hypothetical protein